MGADLKQQIATHSQIGLDTSIFIYHLEANPTYLSLTRQIFTQVETGQCQALTSTITLMELTVHPWRNRRADVARQYETLLVNFPNLRLLDVTRQIARRAAQLRATFNVRPADAVQVASALAGGATLWVSNDKQLTRLAPVIDILLLDDYLTAS